MTAPYYDADFENRRKREKKEAETFIVSQVDRVVAAIRDLHPDVKDEQTMRVESATGCMAPPENLPAYPAACVGTVYMTDTASLTLRVVSEYRGSKRCLRLVVAENGMSGAQLTVELGSGQVIDLVNALEEWKDIWSAEKQLGDHINRTERNSH